MDSVCYLTFNMIISLFTTFFIIYITILTIYRRRKYPKEAAQHVPMYLGLIHHTPYFFPGLKYSNQVWEFSKKRERIDQHLSIIWVLPHLPIFMIHTPEAAQKFLTSKNKNKSWPMTFLRCWIGDGILLSDQEKWAPRRKLITPAFHFDILTDSTSLINLYASNFCRKLKEPAVNAKVSRIDLFPWINLYTLDVIIELALGAQMNFLDGSEESKEFIDNMRKLHEKMSVTTILPKNLLEGIRLVKWYSKWIEDRIEDRINIRNTTPESSDSGLDSMTMSRSYDRRTSATFGTERYIFIDRILDEYFEGNMSKEAIMEETKTFIMAGQETTASSIYHTLIALCQYPKVQEKLIAEIDEYFDSSYVYVENSDFENLPYLDAVVREGLRFYPSARQWF